MAPKATPKPPKVRPKSVAKKEDITTYNRQARLQLLGFPKRFAENNPCAQAYILLDFALRTLGDFSKRPLLRISKTFLQLSKYLDILEEEHKARAKNTTGPRQDTAKASPKREPPEKKWGGGTPPKGGFQLNKRSTVFDFVASKLTVTTWCSLSHPVLFPN